MHKSINQKPFMEKSAAFIVNKRYYILAVILVIAVVFAVFIPSVNINNDMTKYLPSDSAMRQGLDIMEKEFPEAENPKGIRVMFTDLKREQIAEVKTKLESIENVESVSYDTSDRYNKNNHTLFILNMSCEYGSMEEKAILNTLESEFPDYNMCYKNNDLSIGGLPLWILLTALAIIIVFLFIMCSSWFDPVLILGVIGIAVAMNMGSNIILGSISVITFSIGAMLQLVLSMDYSIILMNRYKQERRHNENKLEAMKDALTNSFVSIASSSLTTIVGLLMLCFMSFTIGFDLGIVLAKGVFFSLLCVFTILPTFILLCDKLLLKTEKKRINKNIQNDAVKQPYDKSAGTPVCVTSDASITKKSRRTFSDVMAGFEFKARYAIMVVFAVLFTLVCIFQSYTPTNFTVNTGDTIVEVFPMDNPIVIVYDNENENEIVEIIDKFSKNEYVSSVSSYANTLGKPYHAVELSQMIGASGGNLEMDISLINIIYYDKLDGTIYPMKAGTFFGYVYDLAQNESFSDFIPAELSAQIEILYNFSNKDNLITPLPSAVIAAMFGIGETQVNAILQVGGKTEPATLTEFVNIAAEISKDPNAGIDETTAKQLVSAQRVINAVVSDTDYSADAMTELIGLDKNTTELLYLSYASYLHSDSNWQLSLHEFINHVADMTNGKLSTLLDEEIKATVFAMKTQLDDGAAQLKGNHYSRLILNTILPEEGEETTAFFNELTAALDGKNVEYYAIGNSAMNYEMSKTFDNELLLITILTIFAIFIVVALSFRNLFIPAILVLLIQCGVYVTVVALHATGIYFLALLIVECILMGATIDYGILFTNYYCEYRTTMTPKEAVKKSYKGAMHTILTSGLILILVTGIIGLLTSGSMSEIVLALSIGTLSSVFLILLILPALLITFDKFVMHRIVFKRKNVNNKDAVEQSVNNDSSTK